MTSTIERPQVAQISTRDVKPPVGAIYGEPHPRVWATETVKRDDWEVVAYRRKIRSKAAGLITAHAYIEQAATPDASPELVVDVTGGFRLNLEANPRDTDAPRLSGISMYDIEAEAYPFHADYFGRRVRPGILEVLADALGLDGDAELAGHLGIEVLRITLWRHGFTPLGGGSGYDEAKEVLVRTGLARDRYHASRLFMVPGKYRD